MNRLFKISNLSLYIFICISTTFAQETCKVNNQVFQSGESLTYEIHYSWGLIWVGTGEVTFRADTATYRGKSCYRLSGTGNSYPKYDWFYKVRDKFESYIDSVTLKPYRYVRNTNEAGHKVYNDNYFSFPQKKAYWVGYEDKKPLKKDTAVINDCTFDVMTMIYYARCIDFTKYKPNDKIPISMYLDGSVYELYVRYLGKDVLKTPEGKYNCIKFKPLLIKGTVFSGGEQMTVWVSDDKNKIPLFVETPIVVGTIKTYLKSYKGLKHKFTAKVE